MDNPSDMKVSYEISWGLRAVVPRRISSRGPTAEVYQIRCKNSIYANDTPRHGEYSPPSTKTAASTALWVVFRKHFVSSRQGRVGDTGEAGSTDRDLAALCNSTVHLVV
ncbi:unnamed protein product [Leuciscus chuanchicus]